MLKAKQVNVRARRGIAAVTVTQNNETKTSATGEVHVERKKNNSIEIPKTCQRPILGNLGKVIETQFILVKF
jgi:hypothetical protein